MSRSIPTFQRYFRTHKPPLLARMGQERSVLPAAGRRGVQARHSERDCALLRHRTFRARDACGGDRGRDPRLPSRLKFASGETPEWRRQSRASPGRAKSLAGRQACALRPHWTPLQNRRPKRRRRTSLRKQASALRRAGGDRPSCFGRGAVGRPHLRTVGGNQFVSRPAPTRTRGYGFAILSR